MLAAFGDVTVITRANNRHAIESELPTTPERDRMQFVFVDLPRWARFWKRGQHGVHLYYLLWQLAALRAARRMHRDTTFDIVWHVTMTNAWMGTMAAFVRAPFVYGPIGGGVRTPRRLIFSSGVRGLLRESVYALLQSVTRRLNPMVHIAGRRAQLILTQNPETCEWLPAPHRRKAVVFPNAVVALPVTEPVRRKHSSVALFAGQLVPGKAVSLAVRALSDLPGWRLIVCGDGPEERRLRRLASALHVAERVEFRGWVARPEVFRVMAEEADVFVFPSLHEGSPWALHEARAAGLPIVCLDRCGSTSLATVAVRTGWPKATARALAAGVLEARAKAPAFAPAFDLDSRRRCLAGVLHDAGFSVDRVALDEPLQ
jgi:glycosyltransferase involved in cell wall biosynthesis